MAKTEAGRRQLERWMERSSMTQDEVASAIGCKRPMVNLILSGRRRPSLDLASNIEQVTGIPASAFAEVA